MTTASADGSGRRRVCMFVYNTFTNDSRVLNTSRTLAAGHDVTLIAREAPGLPTEGRVAAVRVLRVDNTALPVRLARRVAARLARRKAGRGGGGDAAAAEAPAIPTKGPTARMRSALRATLVRTSLPIGQLQYWRRAVRAAANDDADVYYANDLDTLPAAWLACRRRGRDARLVYDSHELFLARDIWPKRTWLALRFWRALERWLIQRADRVVATSEGMADELTRSYGIERPAIVRSVPPLSPPRPAPDLHAELGLGRELAIVLYLGGYDAGRGLEQLVDVAGMVPEIAVVAFGFGEPGYVAALEARIREARVSERVRLAGAVAPGAVVERAMGADIGACLIQNTCLTYYHSLPNKLFQYLAAGLPVVASDFPAMGRIVREHDAGVVCSPSDPDAIADAIRGMLADPARLAEYRANALAAARVLNWEAEEPRLVAAVDAALGRNRAPAAGA